MSAWISTFARCARNSFSPSRSARLLMRWLSLSTSTRIGPESRSIDSTTWPDSLIASSTPSAVRSATPSTSIRPPDRSVAEPRMTPLSFLTSWPSGKSEAMISSSVTAGPPDPVGKGNELIGRQLWNGLGMRDAFRRPDVHGIAAVTEATQPVGKPPLLGPQSVETERSDQAEQLQRGLAKILHIVVGEDIGGTEQTAMLASHGPPDQGAIAGIELLDAAIGLDHFGARHCDTPRLRDGESGATACDQATAAIAAGPAADQADDLHACAAGFHQGAHDLGDGQLASIRLLQADAAGIEQDQDGDRADLTRGAEEPGQLGTVHLAKRATHEAAFLRSDEHRRVVEAAVTDDDAVVELLGKVEYLQMRADFALLRSNE